MHEAHDWGEAMGMSQLYQKIEAHAESAAAQLSKDEQLTAEFYRRLDTSWIYHDNALEGIVLSHHELNSALDEAKRSSAGPICHLPK